MTSLHSAFAEPVNECNQHVFVCYENEKIFDGCKEDKAEITFMGVENGVGRLIKNYDYYKYLTT